LELGLVYAAGGASGVLASLFVARLGSPRRQITVLWCSYALSGVAVVAIALAPNVLVTGFLEAGYVGFMLYGDVLFFAWMQRIVPHEFLGRVSSLVFLFAWSLGPLGILLGGLAATTIGVRHSIFIGGVLSAVTCLGVLFVPGVRDPEREAPTNAPDVA
jgi:MFS family permease